MDWWLRGRIIYTYSLWVVFKAAAVGGIFGECFIISFVLFHMGLFPPFGATL